MQNSASNAASHPSWLDYWELCRPFTLLAPFIGFVAFALAGWSGLEAAGAAQALPPILMGALAAACLNAASNIINQVYDLEIDRVNKPARPIPSGRVNPEAALKASVILYAASIALAWAVGVQFFVILLFTVFLTYAYSGPPFRTKRSWLWANLTIALPRGCLLVVAGWTALRDAWNPEPWILGAVFGLYIFGAATTKDFADIRGDEQGGCITLPVRFGVRRAAWMISPFFVLPWIVLFAAAGMGWLSGSRTALMALAAILSVWGAYVAYLILRRPDELATESNHVSWKHMYLIMLVGQLGSAAAYLIR